MISINPIGLNGPWTEGYALDIQINSSTFIGYDEYGHPRFENERSEVGELLYRLKYGNEKSATNPLKALAASFIVDKWNPKLDLIIPAPPSKKRDFQPVLAIASQIAEETGIKYVEAIRKIKPTPQLKDVSDFDEKAKMLNEAFEVDGSLVNGKSILLFDDLFSSGVTLRVLTELLLKNGVDAVFALTLTKAGKR